MPADTNPNVSAKILKMVSDTLRIDKKRSAAVVDDISLLNVQGTEDTTASSVVRVSFLPACYQSITKYAVILLIKLLLGPPFAPFEFSSIPVESYPPQVYPYLVNDVLVVVHSYSQL